MKQKIVVLTGAGISAESGLQTFRGSDGLWNGFRIEEVASWDGWQRDPKKVLDFYNQRRTDAAAAEPNEAHRALADLERAYDVQIITQNVDDLHERGGSTNVMHLHGLLRMARSSQNERLVYDIGDRPIAWGDTCELGSQLRPHIVWFGEMVPLIEPAMRLAAEADLFMVIGTSMVVYPAASLIHYVRDEVPKYLIDLYPNEEAIGYIPNLTVLGRAGNGGGKEGGG